MGHSYVGYPPGLVKINIFVSGLIGIVLPFLGSDLRPFWLSTSLGSVFRVIPGNWDRLRSWGRLYRTASLFAGVSGSGPGPSWVMTLGPSHKDGYDSGWLWGRAGTDSQ